MVVFGQQSGGRVPAAPGTGPALVPSGWPGVHTTTLRDVPDRLPVRPHRLDHHLLLLVTAGHGGQSVDFVAHPCRPGTLVWARPGQVIRYGRQPGLDAILVGWRAELLGALEVDAPALTDPFGPTHWQLTGEDEDAIINEVSQLVVDCERYRAGGLPVELLRHQLAVLMLRIAALPTAPAAQPRPPHDARAGATPPYDARAGAAPPHDPRATPAHDARAGATPAHDARAGATPAHDARAGATLPNDAWPAADTTFLRFRRQVERWYVDTRRVEDYAARLGCSVRTLTRASLAATGRSAKQVIDDRAALEARRLLACTDLQIADIGQRLGFPEPTNFGRFFHREVGCSPGAFRGRALRPDPPVPAPRRPPPH
jgi:AraC-like DNA-binding protein